MTKPGKRVLEAEGVDFTFDVRAKELKFVEATCVRRIQE